MNYRALCQDFVKELGIAGGVGPSSVVNQSGEFANVARWIAESSLWIDNLWRDWKYLWREHTAVLSGQSFELATAGEIDRTSVYLDYGTRTAKCLYWVEWKTMRETRARPPLTGRPVNFSVSPRNEIWLDRPATGSPLRFEYWARPIRLVDDADVPVLPEEFHRLIICRAAIMYGNREAAGEVISGMEAEYLDLLEKLQSGQLEAFRNERMSGQDVPLHFEHP